MEPKLLDKFTATCKGDFPFYASKCLKCNDKAGKLVEFQLNRAQRFVHEKIEEQRAKTGKVRVNILKGRQQGISLYVQGRFRWRLKHGRGLKAYVMAHEVAATNNLFVLADRFHKNEPAEVRPHVGASNSKELWFDGLDCRYEVVTAGSKEVGRSGTAQLFHGSEAAFWPNAAGHFAGIGQTLPDAAGTEIILESTSDGPTGEFYKGWKIAERGESDYINIFVPWYWQDEYTKDVDGFEMRADEADLARRFRLTPGQMAWRRNKIDSDFKGDINKFHREYPMTAAEAFAAADVDSFVKFQDAEAARGNDGVMANGPLVIGVDVARSPVGDRTAFVWRQGRVVTKIKVMRGRSSTQIAGLLRDIIEDERPERVFIDLGGGWGVGVCDILHSWGYEKHNDGKTPLVVGVQPAGKATDSDRFFNKRAECHWRMGEWFADQPVQIPNDDEVVTDCVMTRYSYRGDRVLGEDKNDVKAREGKSPDIGDGLALTFAEPVKARRRDPAPTQAPWTPLDEVTGI